MRKLSCKWPVYLTLFAFLPPVFYVWFRIGKPEIFNPTQLMEKVVGAGVIAMIVWLVYGVASLLARKVLLRAVIVLSLVWKLFRFRECIFLP